MAPEIHRQRAVIEGYPLKNIVADDIRAYLKGLSKILKMKALIDPVVHRSPKFGEAGWIHWESSGAHFYAWDTPKLFFSVDIYTCKAFDVNDAVKYTKDFFKIKRMEHVEFEEF